MCGIAGLVNIGDGELLDAMTDVQQHRGPDDRGARSWTLPDGTFIGIGSRRLSILDLSAAGHMPMSNADGTLWIVHNGEVYNSPELRAELVSRGHRFRSTGDTEVILQLYAQLGPDCVHRLNGMFAFAICDMRGSSPRLFIARDHFGIKPLYFVQRGRSFAFASEIRPLLMLPGFAARVDLQALHRYLTFLWVPESGTMFAGIEKLPPGHHATFVDGRLTSREYWNPRFPAAQTVYHESESELTERVRDMVRRAVKRQMLSDVPVGAFLSAGLDSTTIVGLMGEASHVGPVRTYTVTFPRRDRIGETTLDDPAVAASTARKFGCEHQEIVLDAGAADVLPAIVRHMEEPVADPALISAFSVCRAASGSSRVLLSGIGGDEVFGGYRKYAAHRWSDQYRRLPGVLRPAWLEQGLARLPSMRSTPLKGPVRLLKKLARSAALPREDAFLMNSTYLAEAQQQSLLTPAVWDAIAGTDPWAIHRGHFARIRHADFLHQMMYLDVKTFLVSLNLNYNDKMSMASSVEVRVPFLDRELWDFAANDVPPHLKLRGLVRPVTKYILRRAVADLVPPAVLRQPKAGFGAPIDYWLAGDLREMVDDLLSPTEVRRRGLFDPAAVGRLIEEQRRGAQDWSMQIWQLLTLELWFRAFIDSSPQALVRTPSLAAVPS